MSESSASVYASASSGFLFPIGRRKRLPPDYQNTSDWQAETPALLFHKGEQAVGFDIRPRFSFAVGPVYFDSLNRGRISKSEMYAGVTCAEVARISIGSPP